MTEEKKEPFNAKTLKMVLEKEIEDRYAKYRSDQVLATRQKGEPSSITHYINAQETENMLERIISQLGGGAREQGMIFVSVKDKNGGFVTSDIDCDKIIVSVAYGQELIINNREYPPKESGGETAEPPSIPGQTRTKIPASGAAPPEARPKKAPKPVAVSNGKPANKAGIDNNHIRAKQIQLVKELKKRLDRLWINRKGLGVDFNNPGALQIELVQDSPGITKLVQEIGKEKLFVGIDQKTGLIKVYIGSKILLKWEFPEDEM